MNDTQALLERLRQHIQAGTTYEHQGDLQLKGILDIWELPSLRVTGTLELIDLENLEKMGESAEVDGSLLIEQAEGLVHLPRRVKANTIILKYLTLCKSIGEDVTAKCVHIDSLLSLEDIPSSIRRLKSFTIKNCNQLTSLFSVPAYWSAEEVHIEECRQIRTLPDGFTVRQNLSIVDCEGFEAVPNNVFVGNTLNLTGCKNLSRLGHHLWIGKDLILKDSGITQLPDDLYCEGVIEIEGTRLVGKQKALQEHKVQWKGFDVGKLTSYPVELDLVRSILAIRNRKDRWAAIQRFGAGKVMKACGIRFCDQVEDPFKAIERIERGENVMDLYFISLGHGRKAYSIDIREFEHLPRWNEAALIHRSSAAATDMILGRNKN